MLEGKFEELKGETLVSVEGGVGEERMVLKTESGKEFMMFHDQDCCESVEIADITGDLADLIGSPILVAEEASSDKRPADVPEPDYQPESETWTFYKLATIKGYVDIRWHGTSNGWYSESVYFQRNK